MMPYYTRQDYQYIEQALIYYLAFLQRQTIQSIDHEEINEVKRLIHKVEATNHHYSLIPNPHIKKR